MMRSPDFITSPDARTMRSHTKRFAALGRVVRAAQQEQTTIEQPQPYQHYDSLTILEPHDSFYDQDTDTTPVRRSLAINFLQEGVDIPDYPRTEEKPVEVDESESPPAVVIDITPRLQERDRAMRFKNATMFGKIALVLADAARSTSERVLQIFRPHAELKIAAYKDSRSDSQPPMAPTG